MPPQQRTQTDVRPPQRPDGRADSPFTSSESIRLTPGNANVSAARRFVTTWLAGTAGLDPAGDVCADLALVTSELVTNAFEHGGDAPVDVTIAFDGATCTLTVASSGSGAIAPSSDWRVAGADSVTGRGLGIVKSLVDSVHVEQHGDRTIITVARRAR